MMLRWIDVCHRRGWDESVEVARGGLAIGAQVQCLVSGVGQLAGQPARPDNKQSRVLNVSDDVDAESVFYY